MNTRRVPSWKLALLAGVVAGTVLASPLPVLASGTRFVRGNVDADGTVAISDAVQILNHLFLGAAAPVCLDAADVDDSGALGLTDAVRVLVFLFAGSATPANPYPGCGEDTTPGLGCASFPACDGPSATAIAGRTVAQDGLPLAGAKLSGGARVAYSGPDGVFEILNPQGGPKIRVVASLGERTAERDVFQQAGIVDIGDLVLQEPSGPGTCGNAVGRAVEYGCGRVFAWGDEHVLFAEYLPQSVRFWENALGWLAEASCSGAPRTRVGMNWFRNELAPVITGLGMTVADFHGGSLDDFEVLIVHGGFPGLDAGALRDWVEAGGALMTLVSGVGEHHPQECDDANEWTAPFGLLYDCAHAPPWSVTGFEGHAIAEGLNTANTPFVNGRFVAEEAAAGSEVVARSGDCHPREIADCRQPAVLHDGTPPDGEVIVESDCGQTAMIADTDAATGEVELHILSIYESRSREVAVRVEREGRHVLALTAYGGDCNGTAGEHHWTVTAGPGATIEKVIVSGLEPPTASVPEGTAVEVFSAEKWLGYSYGDDCGGGNTPRMIENVETAAGLKMRSFHGCYEASQFRIVGGTP